MTWSAPEPGPQSSPSQWERGGTTLFPAGRLADRISTVLLLSAGALLTILAAIVAVIATISATATCNAAAGCTPGAYFGGAAIAVGGAFVVGVATVVLAIGAWIRRRTSWWIAAVGFVLAIACVTWGGVVFADAADSAPASSPGSSIA
ncbi:DUF6264 family protein [Curtobacterium sp. MCLR17_007]|uniref:DUF6264 family protein n=1 Tax=unclassified Curtobacterium TaxID=257496 RepID=UPI0007004E77|nr:MULTISPECIES: DUF6264 family protein [unclassified Curtobacterium]KQS10676.1 hypothetical protein ASG04_04130 [Curtobacterium sp. Leaf183]WIB59726.1 DUF6264 family protein [Curtobacterium sp. MCLR17_007]